MLSKSWFKAVIALIIIALAGLAWVLIKNSAPKPERKPIEKTVLLVDTQALIQETSRPSWQTGGTVQASQSVVIIPQVSGSIIWMNPKVAPGSIIKKGQVLAKIESTDYQLAIEQQQAAVAQAEANLMLEQAQGQLALEEYQLSGKQLNTQDKALVLRKPQLKSAEASLQSAKALLKQAQKNLARTQITMPFAGQIIEQGVHLGSLANTGSSAFSVVATDEFWLEVKIPHAFLALLDKQAEATLSKDNPRSATILNILPEVDAVDRQVKLILSIPDPLDDAKGAVTLINDYVDVEIFGREIINAYVIPRGKIKDGGYVWVVNQEKLYKRPVELDYISREFAWVSSGFEADDELLLTDIDVPIEGMQIRVSKPDGESL